MGPGGSGTTPISILGSEVLDIGALSNLLILLQKANCIFLNSFNHNVLLTNKIGDYSSLLKNCFVTEDNLWSRIVETNVNICVYFDVHASYYLAVL